MSGKNYSLEPFRFLEVKRFLKKKICLILFIIILCTVFILIFIVSKSTVSNQEIFNVLQGKIPGVFLTKRCVRISENDSKLVYRLSEYLKDSDYFSNRSVANIIFLNFPYILDNSNDKQATVARKQVFVKAILPIIIKANQEALNDRKKVIYLNGRMPKNELSDKDIEIFTYLVNKYNVKVKVNTPWDIITGINALMVKVNVIPNSLVLALAIVETDWGMSKSLKDSNSLFSERIYGASMNNLQSSKKSKNDNSMKKFSTLSDSVYLFFSKVNSSNQYKEFRDLRFKQVNSNRGIDVYSLTNPLSNCIQNKSYVGALKTVIKDNKLTVFDKYDALKDKQLLCLYFQ